MNTLEYLQYFDGLADKYMASFSLEHIPQESCEPDEMGQFPIHRCSFDVAHEHYQGSGPSRKEALKALYRKLRKYRK